ncbi:hypothetical protein IFM89_022207 [Coptis chinensis]|uniref:DNA repair protein RAD50 n=1 Tax=Coptis chinensis TaxID=261450 RepID=A0A835HX82_9MAGN|nr:hypothetical protein IFM89_022207 [Coptis chinensis]
MSTVDKMLIKGIRSYSPDNKHVVTFFKPLTLIVGSNGAGKTTIIECLKLSCTGELPPNARSGHSFVHDPKVKGDTETKGQIKLRFKTAAGKDVVCIRSFQLTQKATKMEFKAIESVLQTINPHSGEKVCLSYRCADMDREIPALMGVSKAILENVIFVHQDDANWPLQDPSTLKKKFDDIFSATRYTKALEIIKKLHKDQAQEIKTYKLKLENLQVLKDAACKLRENIDEDQEETKTLKSQIQELERNVQKVEAKIQQTETTLKDLQDLRDQISTKTTERRTLFQLQQTQYAALEEENEDTDEELKEWQTTFEEKIARLESRISKVEREMKDIDIKSSSLRGAIIQYSRDIGKLQQEAEKSNEMELSALWDSYMKACERCSKLGGQKSAKADAKITILNSIKDKEKERDDTEAELSGLDIVRIDEKEKNLCKEVDRKTRQFEEKEFESNIHQKEIEIFSLEQKIRTLSGERDVMASDSEDRLRLGIRRTGVEDVQKKHRKIIDENKDRIRGVLKGRLPLDKDLKKDIDQVFRSLEKECDDLNSKSVEANQEVKVFQMKIRDVKENLSKFQRDMDARKRSIDSKAQFLVLQCSIESFPEVLQKVMEKRDLQKSKYNMADGMRKMFEPFERVARANHFCPCCERSFSPEEEDNFVKKQRKKAADSAEHMKFLAVDVSNADSQFQQLDNLRMIYEEYLKLGRDTIPQTEKTLKELTEDLDEKLQALDDVVGVLAHVKSEKDLVEALLQPVETADRLLSEIQTLQGEVSDLESRLDAQGHGVKSMEEIQSQLTMLQNLRDNLNNELRKLWEEQHHMKSDLSNAQMRWHLAREEKSRASNILDRVKKAEEDINSLAEQKDQLDLDEKHLSEALVPLSKEKEKFLNDHNNLKLKFVQETDEQDELQRSCRQEVKNLLAKAFDIKEKTKAKVDELTHEIESLEDRILKIGGVSTFEADHKKHLQEKVRLRSELDRCHGTLSVYQAKVSKLKIDLKQAQYNDIDNRYFNQLIQLKTTEMANKDLDRYYHALDKALMRFHSMKMEEINKIIRELWQQTYRGQDIDYISIHSDSESAGTRSYSYRVLMQTGDAELEMRGRCSAGQKVLASLIIRLALAETFCLNCGILALDEPTTNLDGPNAESLAAALLRIMDDRKGQENFQLIVITHDERFAQLIGQRQHAEKYYRVAKNDRQHSIIEAQEIFD